MGRAGPSTGEGETCHYCSLRGSPSPGQPHRDGDPRAGVPSTRGAAVRAAKPRGTAVPRCPQAPTQPTSACREPAGREGPRLGAAAGAGCWETPHSDSQREKPGQAAASLPRRSRRLRGALPTPGALCLPAIFGSLLRAPLRLLIMRVRNAFGLSYIREGRGLEAAKYTGACGSKRGGFGTECGKEIV